MCRAVRANPIAPATPRIYKSSIPMAQATVPSAVTKQGPERASPPDPLGFLAGRRYTCYCGRSVVGTMLCPSCADEMVLHFRRVARQPTENR